ncbi:MAG TPA: urease accessory protein UreD [Stellaceae bacterium]|jgi:urease accessory protein|nr:urease accessory protein UreD [Stellaceae bacterium]
MLDAQPRTLSRPSEIPADPPLTRSEGSLRLSLKRRGDLTVVDRLFQSGCLKARFATPDPRATGDAILINTAGGLTGGDHLSIDIRWGAGTRSTVAGQAAEKIYRSIGGAARVTTTLELEADAHGEWLPQETILFDRAALDRDIVVRLAPDATFLGLEAVVLGRRAMAETVTEGRWRDAWRIWRDGKLLCADVVELKGGIADLLRRQAVARGSIAFATLIWVGPGTTALRDQLRGVLTDADGCAASAWNGLLAVRFLAQDGAALRRHILQALGILRPDRPAPPLWQY